MVSCDVYFIYFIIFKASENDVLTLCPKSTWYLISIAIRKEKEILE